MDAMVALQHRLRVTLKERMTTPEVRKKILWSVLRDKYIWSILSKSPDKVWERVEEKYLS
jgi:hypothetical protein